MAKDGSFAISVGTDRKILLFDIRVSKAVASMAATVARPVVMNKGLMEATAILVKGSVNENVRIPRSPHRTPA